MAPLVSAIAFFWSHYDLIAQKKKKKKKKKKIK